MQIQTCIGIILFGSGLSLLAVGYTYLLIHKKSFTLAKRAILASVFLLIMLLIFALFAALSEAVNIYTSGRVTILSCPRSSLSSSTATDPSETVCSLPLQE